MAGALFMIGLWSMFRGWLHGSSIGDNSDGGIVVAILEHWVRVFTGLAADWRSPGWYWPAPHALGLSDSLFLLAMPYAVARAAGAGWFAANDLAIATMATAGFWGMIVLVRRLGGAVAIGGVVGFVFSFGVVPEFKLGHAQTYTMQLAPVLGLLLLAAWRQGSWRSAGAAGLLYGLMLFTAAQTPWFLGLEAGMALLAGGLLARRRIEWRRGLLLMPGFGAGMAVGMVPFVALYRDSFGLRRDFSAAHYFSGRPLDLFNIPPGEVMWFDLLHRAGIAGNAARPMAELALGLTPVLAVAGVAALVLVRRGAPMVGALLAAGLLGPLLAIDWGGVEPWKLVFWFVPGGNAVRTPFRIELAAQFFLCLGLGLALSRGIVRGGVMRAGLVGLMVVLVTEQIGEKPSGRDNAVMDAWLGAARRPAFACEAFYLVPGGGTGPWHQYQADAMMLSQKIGMPTVNGNSSFYPEGWDMPFTDRPEYAGKTLAWIDAHGVRGRVCGADPRRGIWVKGVGALER